MTREIGRNLMRERIAHIAARLMAQDGIEDYALAKRKAARQAGISQTSQLPDNDQIDAALRSYREIYQSGHASHLRSLRQLALEIMNDFADFDPHLTGSVLSGSAGKYAGIQLQLFSDNSKSIEHFLLNRGVDFRSEEVRLYESDKVLDVPVLLFDRDNVEIRLMVLSSRDRRIQLKFSPDGRPIERANRDAVGNLVVAP
jgi:hypothetical protein